MKIIYSLFIIALLIAPKVFSQDFAYDSLNIAFNKTTSIVFPYSITSVDRGSRDVLAQKAHGVENVLQLKAANKTFPETNITVITADGKLHHFVINYLDNPKSYIHYISFLNRNTISEFPILFHDNLNAARLALISKRILKFRVPGKVVGEKKSNIKFSIKEIFIQDDLMFFKIQIRNASNVRYDIGSLRFYFRDREKVKRTATQEIEICPVHIEGKIEKITGQATIDAVYVLPKFTLADGKALEVDLIEKDGGRNLKLRLFNNKILQAKRIHIK